MIKNPRKAGRNVIIFSLNHLVMALNPWNYAINYLVAACISLQDVLQQINQIKCNIPEHQSF